MSSKDKLLASAQKSLQKGQVAKAIKDYQKVVEQDAKDVRSKQKLAELLSRAKRNEEALDVYEGVASHYADTGFYLKAIAVYKQMQKIDPAQERIYHRLAELNEKQGLVGNALAEYRHLVDFYENKQMLNEATEVLEKMKELDPENLNIRVKIAENYAQGGLKDQAREEFKEVLEVLQHKGDENKTLKLYEVILPIFPEDSDLKSGFAETLRKQGDPEKAIQILRNMLQDAPEDLVVLGCLARAYREKEDFENERLTYQHLLKHAPDDLELQEHFLQACLDAGEAERALGELEVRRDNFVEAGLEKRLGEFYLALQRHLPNDDRVRAGVSSFAGGQATGDQPPSEPASVAADSPTEASEEEPAEVSVEAGEKSDQVEEIPLDFLEGVEEFDLNSESPQPPVAGDDEKGEAQAEAEISEAPAERDPEEPAVAKTAPGISGPEGNEDADDEEEMELEVELEDPFAESLDEGEGSAAMTAEGETPEEFEEPVEELEEPVEELEEPVEELEEPVEELGEPIEELEESAGAEEDLLDTELDQVLGGAQEASVTDGLARELEEAEFYLQQNLFSEAEQICRSLLESHPDAERVHDKLAEIESRRAAAASGPTEAPSSVPEAQTPSEEDRKGDDPFGLDGIFSEFKKGVETQLDGEDTEAHYNLGIAYKEMGLIDDAVGEFDRALKDPERFVDCIILKGLCLVEKGAFDEAEKTFRTGLESENLAPGERLSLNYELGQLYEAWEKPMEALECFQYVADADLFYRDVGEKTKALKVRLGLDDGQTEGEPGNQGKKDRVSYL